MIIPRRSFERVREALASFPVVALLGPRQVGKTTLALEVGRTLGREFTYLDLELESDRAKLGEAELYLRGQMRRLLIVDEVQRRPDLFPLLRGIVDARIRDGERSGQFLILGSASRDLLRQSSETLAGRIAYLELPPLSLVETASVAGTPDVDALWLRGGFPNSFLASSDVLSWQWRGDFIATYLERDIPQLGLRLPAEQMRRLWTMLAHGQGTPLNASRLAASLGVSAPTVRHYLDVLTDLYMVRQLRPWSGNATKRLVKAPRTYVRDSGLLHRLANIPDLDTLLGHPLCGQSWEGFATECLLAQLPDTWQATYYRTQARAEIDLVLEGPRAQVMAIEIKRTLSPRVSRGFRLGCDEVGATQRFYVIPHGEPFPLGHDTEAIGLPGMVARLLGVGVRPMDGRKNKKDDAAHRA